MPKAKSGPKKSTRLPRAGTDSRFQAEDDLRTLQRAGEIKSDAGRMKQAKALATHQASNLSKIAKSK